MAGRKSILLIISPDFKFVMDNVETATLGLRVLYVTSLLSLVTPTKATFTVLVVVVMVVVNGVVFVVVIVVIVVCGAEVCADVTKVASEAINRKLIHIPYLRISLVPDMNEITKSKFDPSDKIKFKTKLFKLSNVDMRFCARRRMHEVIRQLPDDNTTTICM